MINPGEQMQADWTILHGGALGDLALTLQLAFRLPGVTAASTLTVVSRVDPGDLSAARPSIQRLSSETVGVHWLYGDSADAPPPRLRELIEGRHVLNALGDSDSKAHQVLRSLGAAQVWSYDPRPRTDNARHITEQWRQALERQGLIFPKCIHATRGRTALQIPRDSGRDRSAAAASLKVIIHPGSGGQTKCWPLACFRATAHGLMETGASVVFLLGPVELERWPAADVEALRTEFRVVESPNPNELRDALVSADALLSNDSGPAHLAALLGTPTVTIFGPTAAAIWRPLGPQAHVIVGDVRKEIDWGLPPSGVIAVLRRTAELAS